MAEYINTLDLLGDDVALAKLIDGSHTEIKDDIVTKIKGYCFYDRTNLTNVDFPNVTSMGNFAFSGCSKLASINFPLLTTIPTKAFFSCSNLNNVNLPSATRVNNQAFQSCINLANVVLPNATTVLDNAFYHCDKLAKIDLPKVTNIASNVFQSCQSLKTLILRSTTMCTLDKVFSDTPINKGAGYIYVPRSLLDTYKSNSVWSTFANQFRVLEDYTENGDIESDWVEKYSVRFLDGNSVLQESLVPYGEMPTYNGEEPTKEDYAFMGWIAEIGGVTGDVDYVANFKSMKSLTRTLLDRSITEVSSNATSVRNYAFNYCSKLTTVDLPLATSINANGFADCTELTRVDLGNATNIAYGAFDGCSKLTTLILRSSTMCTLASANEFAYIPIGKGTGYIYVHDDLVDSYKGDTKWSKYANQIKSISELGV